MKASLVLRTCALMAGALMLCQCSMPTAQTWRYIQTNGLLTYWNQGMRPSPPLSSGSSRLHYARSGHTTMRPDIHSMAMWGSGMPNRIPYRPVPTSRYYSTPSSDATHAAKRPATHNRPKPAVVTRESSPPKVKIPVEEPVAPQPQITQNTAPESKPPAPMQPKTAELPYGSAVPGRPNMVNSPYAGKTQLVDVSGMSAGQTVKCPYTGKLFKVPPTEQAANKASPDLESAGGEKKP